MQDPARNRSARRASRPPNRRGVIVSEATRLFHAHGYDGVGVGDLAAAAGIGPSALYRHFAGKQDLLSEVIGQKVATVLDALVYADFDDLEAATHQLARMAIDHRELGLLWAREVRHLAPDVQTRLRAELRGLGLTLGRQVMLRRPELDPGTADLLGSAGIAVLNSVSFHRLTLPGDELEQMLADLVTAVLDAPLPLVTLGSPQHDGRPLLAFQTRREALLAEAVRLFAQHGYSRVGIDDVGAAVGIAGPSIYNHFGSKHDMLSTAFQRGVARLFDDLHPVLASTDDPAEALRRFVDAYLRYAAEHHDTVELLVAEVRQLAESEQRMVLLAQRDYVNEWVGLWRALHPDDPITHARIRVHAVLSVINDLMRTSRIRTRPGSVDAVRAVCQALLATDRDG